MKWYQKLWAQLFKGLKGSLAAAPSAAPDWDDDCAGALKMFLASGEGQVLVARARALECKLAIDACTKKTISPDRAAGFSDAVNWLLSLSQISVSPAAHGETYEPRQSAESDAPALEPAFTH